MLEAVDPRMTQSPHKEAMSRMVCLFGIQRLLGHLCLANNFALLVLSADRPKSDPESSNWRCFGSPKLHHRFDLQGGWKGLRPLDLPLPRLELSEDRGRCRLYAGVEDFFGGPSSLPPQLHKIPPRDMHAP